MPDPDMTLLGKTLIIVGGVLLLLGGAFLLVGHIPWSDKLPGDIHLRGKKWDVYFPLATCIIISIILTLILNLVAWVFGK